MSPSSTAFLIRPRLRTLTASAVLWRDNGPRTADFARVFFVPGMTHCGGGQSTDRFDMLGAIQEWVEQGKAPDRIVATGSAFPGITRPLCPYPQIARYVAGNPSDERSFHCR